MFRYVDFHNFILASQMQFSFVLMHILRLECFDTVGWASGRTSGL